VGPLLQCLCEDLSVSHGAGIHDHWRTMSVFVSLFSPLVVYSERLTSSASEFNNVLAYSASMGSMLGASTIFLLMFDTWLNWCCNVYIYFPRYQALLPSLAYAFPFRMV